MKSTFRLIYKFFGFIFLFFLLGTLFVFIETVMIENNTQSFIDESGILQNKYEKSLIPIIASLICSYLIIFQIPWFKKKEIQLFSKLSRIIPVETDTFKDSATPSFLILIQLSTYGSNSLLIPLDSLPNRIIPFLKFLVVPSLF